ncbi:MAG: hypothetical protein ACPL4E_10960 [Thermoproteota archaeon]
MGYKNISGLKCNGNRESVWEGRVTISESIREKAKVKKGYVKIRADERGVIIEPP